MSTSSWPTLPNTDWHLTLTTLHRWTQIVGKLRMVHTPWLNHSWSVPFYLTPRGLTTSHVPHGNGGFEARFDFLSNKVVIETTDGGMQKIVLASKTTAAFYQEVMEAMKALGMETAIHTMPSEIPDATSFDEDEDNATYVAEHAQALWRALVQAERVFTRFRAGFWGKCSPVHFFWGSFDLAVTRFSGRTAPPHPAGIPNFPDDVAREAYSHEVMSAGFWPGNADNPEPIFYGYAYPTPVGFKKARVQPKQAFWLEELGEFAITYKDVAAAGDPDDALMQFVQSVYDAAADLAKWDRESLECSHPFGPDWWHKR